MDWDRGLLRITIVLSIVGAILGAAFFFYDAGQVLEHNERSLIRERRDTVFDESIHAWLLINEWRKAKTLEEQKSLWKEWTGLELGEEPKNKFPANRLIGLLPASEVAETLQKKAEELETLKERGWQTAKGEALPYTPRDVWWVKRRMRIRDLEDTVLWNKIELPIAPVVGAVLGLGVVWAVYAAAKLGAWPVLMWIKCGFSETNQKDGQKTNESGSAGNC